MATMIRIFRTFRTLHSTGGALTALLISGVLGISAHAEEADRFAGVSVTAKPVRGAVYMLEGAGGNIAVSVGNDGTLMVDDQFAPLARRIQTAIDELGGDSPKLVLNTHFHGDHTGSNAFFGRSGTIIAHDNVRVRLLSEQVEPVALPQITFDDNVRLFFNGDAIDVVHLPSGHTDGDSFVWFKDANVLHLGDHFFNGRFPFIDLSSGGSVEGFVTNLRTVLELVPRNALIIPGHGALAGTEELAENLQMIEKTRQTVRDGIAKGLTTEQILAEGLDERWAPYGAGFINEERWIRILVAAEGG